MFRHVNSFLQDLFRSVFYFVLKCFHLCSFSSRLSVFGALLSHWTVSAALGWATFSPHVPNVFSSSGFLGLSASSSVQSLYYSMLHSVVSFHAWVIHLKKINGILEDHFSRVPEFIWLFCFMSITNTVKWLLTLTFNVSLLYKDRRYKWNKTAAWLLCLLDNFIT